MKVFISWSGERSGKVAVILRDWLPSVIQAVDPYVSSEDIDKGDRWSSDVSVQLSKSNYGVLCLTRENLSAPWINFEAGALSKAIDKSRVSPLLIGVSRSEVQWPLAQFQSVLFNHADVKKLVHSINASLPKQRLDAAKVDKAFERWWPELFDQVTPVEASSPPAVTTIPPNQQEKMLEEILELVRQQQRQLADFNPDSIGAILEELNELTHGSKMGNSLWHRLLSQRWHQGSKFAGLFRPTTRAGTEFRSMVDFERAVKNATPEQLELFRELVRNEDNQEDSSSPESDQQRELNDDQTSDTR